MALFNLKIQPSEFWGMPPYMFIRLMQDKAKQNGKPDNITRADLIYSERALRVKGII